ncbi:hypothetical protein N692_05445 [Lactiplantibacillus plantarum EGD-AQ4]|nr:hypothetical protein N692_05445 [Lactiplantibacillus plantarum EGD-AQ4]
MISIIMSTFNGSQTISAAIDSILAQTYENFEFIICDDASTDSTRQILTEYQKKDSRIRLIYNSKNEGLPCSLNNCIRLARGNLIARMDDDDISLEDRCERQIKFLNSHPDISFVGSNILIFDQDKNYGLQRYPEYPTIVDLFSGNQFAHPAMMIRKSALDEAGNYSENINVLRIEDYDLWMRMYARGLIGANLSTPVLRFRENPNSFKRRSVQSRINIVKLLCRSFRNSHTGIKGIKCIFVSAVKVIIPAFVYRLIHAHKYSQEVADR